MSFIILKLYAFRDRIQDEKKDFGRHHAYDIFASILEMGEEDWMSAKNQFHSQSENQIIIEAKQLVSQYFTAEDQWGILRIKENTIYKTNRVLYEPVIPLFISDLKEMFQI